MLIVGGNLKADENWMSTETSLVTDGRMLCSLSWSCLEHTVNQFAHEGWFICNQLIM